MTFLCHKSHEGHEGHEVYEGHEGHEGHEDISAHLHFSAFRRHGDNDNEKNDNEDKDNEDNNNESSSQDHLTDLSRTLGLILNGVHCIHMCSLHICVFIASTSLNPRKLVSPF